MDYRDQILRFLPNHAICAEIGVWEGGFSKQILGSTKPQSLHLIDPWTFDDSFPKSWFGGQEAKNQQHMDDIHTDVVRLFSDHPEVIVKRQTSLQAAQEYPDGFFDWVYLDANHTYPFAAQDLVAWWPRVKFGGYLAGDDYIAGGWFQGGVKRAVDGFVSQRNLKARFFGTQFALLKI
jgi:hypothetical protein